MSVVVISPDLRRELVSLCRSGSASEACGVLIGTRDGDCTTITRVARTTNRTREADAFTCDAGDVVAFDGEARAEGFEIVGFWHSHASADARPSSRDARGSWPDALTAIVRMEGTPSVRFWRLSNDAAIEVRAAASTTCAIALHQHNLRPRPQP